MKAYAIKKGSKYLGHTRLWNSNNWVNSLKEAFLFSKKEAKEVKRNDDKIFELEIKILGEIK